MPDENDHQVNAFDIDGEIHIEAEMIIAFYALGIAWDCFLKLGLTDQDDINDFRKCIHDAQRIIASLPVFNILNLDE